MASGRNTASNALRVRSVVLLLVAAALTILAAVTNGPLL